MTKKKNAPWKGQWAFQQLLPDTPTVPASWVSGGLSFTREAAFQKIGWLPHDGNSYPIPHSYCMKAMEHMLKGEIILLKTKDNFTLLIRIPQEVFYIRDQVDALWGKNAVVQCSVFQFQSSAQLLLVKCTLKGGVPTYPLGAISLHYWKKRNLCFNSEIHKNKFESYFWYFL